MSVVWLGLGANIGDRLSHLQIAIEKLRLHLCSVEVAGFYETAPRDYLDQADFVNTVIRAETDLSPLDLLALLHKIEAEGGRKRSDDSLEEIPEKGPRTIDIDILLYDDLCEIFNTQAGGLLIIPHKSMHERLFVLKPLLDLDDNLTDPRDGVLWRDKASRLGEQRVKPINV